MRIKDVSFRIYLSFKRCSVTDEEPLQKLLVVDDDNIISQLMAALLAGFGTVDMVESDE